jgi:uncharacterized protein (DUF488 family)
METDSFRDGMERLLAWAGNKRTAIMCSEVLWWRCHRALIADYLKVQGAIVLHITSRETSAVHPYTSAAHVIDGKLSYAALQ